MCSDATRTQDTTCEYPGCHRGVWQDPDGSYSAYCASSVTLCTNCASRPVYVQNGKEHDFCGLRCSRAFREGKENVASPRASVAPETPALCKLPNCKKLAFVGLAGEASEYCGNAHRLEAVRTGVAEKCFNCGVWPKAWAGGRMTDFCSKRCSERILEKAPIIVMASESMQIYADVAAQFRTQWHHPTPVPNVIKIWKIFCDKAHNDEFARYRLAVERTRGLPGGNSKRRWHGTVRTCTVGDNARLGKLCHDPVCSLCGIIRTSLCVAKAGRNKRFSRFGAGIYASATSSKADSYVVEQGGSPYRALLLSDVVLGKVMKLKQDRPSLKEPPVGYDSVIGQPGGALNYDEVVVYKNEAIRPLFLLIYQL